MKIESNNLSGQKMHKLLGTVISPRPIALMTTVDADGIYNAAPYSAVTPVSFKPPVMCVASGMKGDQVSAPRIAEAQISLEFRLMQTIEFGEGGDHRSVFFGEVLLFHIKDELWKKDNVDIAAVRSVGRLGPGIYCRTTDIVKFSIS